MRKVRTALGVVATGGVLSMVMSTSVVGAAVAKAQDVFVTNTSTNPVPVAGTVSVGNLPATQPVSGTVNVGNLPSSFATVQLLNSPITPQGTDVTVDVSGYKTVRLNVHGYNGGCGVEGESGIVAVREPATGTQLDYFSYSWRGGPDNGDNGINRVYDTPGRSLTFHIAGDPECGATIVVWGRGN